MGKVRANSDITGTSVNGVLLGAPMLLPDGTYVWDDSRIPDLDMVVPPGAPDDALLMALLGGTA